MMSEAGKTSITTASEMTYFPFVDGNCDCSRDGYRSLILQGFLSEDARHAALLEMAFQTFRSILGGCLRGRRFILVEERKEICGLIFSVLCIRQHPLPTNERVVGLNDVDQMVRITSAPLKLSTICNLVFRRLSWVKQEESRSIFS